MWVDLAIVLIYFSTVLTIGLRKSRRPKDFFDYTLAKREIPWWAILISIVAAETSAATFIGTPGEGFTQKNYTYLQFALGMIMARFLAGILFLKPYYEGKVYSIYEYLKLRFGPKTEKLGSGIFLCTRLLASGSRLYVGAVILVMLIKLHWSLSFLGEFGIYFLAIVTLTIVTSVYTSLGGIRAVIWTDLLQVSVMLGCAVITAIILFKEVGFDALYLKDSFKIFSMGINVHNSFRENIKNILQTDYTLFAGIFGGTFLGLATHGTDQDMVQRMLTAKNLGQSRRSLFVSGFAEAIVIFLFLSIGILMASFYRLNHDAALPIQTNEVFAYFILTRIPMGLRGLMIAGIFATAMGSESAALNALTTSYIRDWKFQKEKPKDEKSVIKSSKKATFIFSFLLIVIASLTSYFVILSPQSRIIPIVMGIFGFTYGSLLGIFLLGVLTKNRGTDNGNLIAAALGFIVVVLMTSYSLIAFPWRIVAGCLTTLIVAFNFKKS